MLSNVSITCFAASYAVVLVLEISRLSFRSGVRGAVMLGFAGAGLLAQSAFLYYRAAGAAGSPLSSFYDWYLLAAWVLVATYLLLVYYHAEAHFGVFLMPLVLGLIATAAFLDKDAAFDRAPAEQAWGMIHGVAFLLALVAVLIGFVAGLMYLGQVRRLKHKRPLSSRLRLPSLEWLQRTNSRALVVSMLMLGAGVVSGVVMNLVKRTGQLSWFDPVVLLTVFVFASTLIGTFYKPARQGRKVAYLTVVSFLVLVIAMGMGLYRQHGGEKNAAEASRPAAGGPA